MLIFAHLQSEYRTYIAVFPFGLVLRLNRGLVGTLHNTGQQPAFPGKWHGSGLSQHVAHVYQRCSIVKVLDNVTQHQER